LSKVAFHFKQWGGVNKKRTGRVLDGRTWDQLPPRHTSERVLAFAE
jgi:protein gp37